MKRISFFFLLLSAALHLTVSCANQGNGPDGGAYDETPPRIVHMTPPEKVVGTKRTKFSLIFDELIKVDNPSEKIVVSPPQNEPPEVKVSGRRITVEILDTIQPNTTYTVDFSDAISDNNEGNPLGLYTYIFSTGAVTDTMEMSGRVLNAEDLEPIKGILVGLHESDADTAFTKTPFRRVARTDASGFFSIKGVSAAKNYNIFALQDADGDFRFSQPGEQIAFHDKQLTPSSIPAVRYDTLWVDTIRYDSIRVTPYTRFLPDDIVLLAFKEARQPRHFLKAQRDIPELFTTFFTAPSTHVPTIRGLNFKAEKAFIQQRSEGNDTIHYWLADTTLLQQDTLRFAYTFEAWDDSLQKNFLNTDTLELVPRVTMAKRKAEKSKELAKWEKQRERRHKRGDYSNEQPPIDFLKLTAGVSGTLVPDKNVMIRFDEPLARLDIKGIHLMLKVDSLLHEAPFELDSVAGDILARTLRAEWRPGQQYELQIDSTAFQSIYGRFNNKLTTNFSISKLEDFGTVFLSLVGASESFRVQLLDNSGRVVRESPVVGNRAEFYYVTPGAYYLRCFDDKNGDGRWTPGEWATRQPPEAVFYFPEELGVRANWDINQNWDIRSKPLDRQKPGKLIKQKKDRKEINTHQRNIERLRNRGE